MTGKIKYSQNPDCTRDHKMSFSRLRTMSRWRLAALGTAGIGVSYVGLRTALDDDFDLYNIGAARFESFSMF